jgi:putative flavoprotein involved in K+ transport
MADYLENYARRFKLPVRTGVRVDRLERVGDHFVVTAGSERFEADNVVVAMAVFQKPIIPALAAELDPQIVQVHSVDYRNPAQLRPGDVLIAGAGNSGAEIAVEVVRSHKVWLAGRDVGHIPFDISGLPARLFLAKLMLRFVFHRVLTVDTPMGRKARPNVIKQGGPLIRQKPAELDALGVQRVPRVARVQNGKPVLADERVLDVANVIWCTGFHPGFSWIDLPIFDERGEPRHEKGIVPEVPGLYFVGLHFLYALSSTMIHGVGRDAERVVRAISGRRAKSWSRLVSARVSRETRSTNEQELTRLSDTHTSLTSRTCPQHSSNRGRMSSAGTLAELSVSSQTQSQPPVTASWQFMRASAFHRAAFSGATDHRERQPYSSARGGPITLPDGDCLGNHWGGMPRRSDRAANFWSKHRCSAPG